MNRYVIIVEFEVHPDTLPRFLELITANAESSLRDEPGCERFDVLIPGGTTDSISLYEIYRDRAAFDDHCRSPHFLSFEAAARALVRSKKVIELKLVDSAALAASPIV